MVFRFKLWRLNKVLQFRRTEVKVKHVAWPAALLFVAAIVLLSVMTVVAPLEWERVLIDSDTGESIGRCTSDSFGAFIWTLAILMFIPMVLTGMMAWKTHDVDAIYSDTFWIGVLIVVQIEVRSSRPTMVFALFGLLIHNFFFFYQIAILGIPLVSILRDVSFGGVCACKHRWVEIRLMLFLSPLDLA